MCINNHNIETFQQRFSPYTHTHTYLRTPSRKLELAHTRTHTHILAGAHTNNTYTRKRAYKHNKLRHVDNAKGSD